MYNLYCFVYISIKAKTRNAETDSDNDLVDLYAFGYHTKWYFPSNMKNCPVEGCRFSKFTTQSAAKMHYTKQHSMNAILCCICCKPISTHSISDYITHYQRKHKNVKNPFDFVENAKVSEVKEVNTQHRCN